MLGSPYLFGVRRNADLFTPKEKAYLIDINYNAYNQEVEFYSTSNPTQPLVKEPGEVDSFIMKQNPDVGLLQDIRFVYGSIIGSNEKAYFQVVQQGTKYALYKRYKSELGYPSSHYSQPELRQFDLTSDYFLHDIKANKLKKLKMNLPAITKEFKSIKDVSAIADKERFSKKPEDETKKLIDYLNQ